MLHQFGPTPHKRQRSFPQAGQRQFSTEYVANVRTAAASAMRTGRLGSVRVTTPATRIMAARAVRVLAAICRTLHFRNEALMAAGSSRLIIAHLPPDGESRCAALRSMATSVRPTIRNAVLRRHG